MARTVKKPEDRRNEIIAAARDLFEEKQYDNTTMNDVMEKLGIAKGTIYHYFKSKEDLLTAVVDHTVNGFIVKMQKTLDESEGSGLDKLCTLIRASNISGERENVLEVLHRPGNIGMHSRQMAYIVLGLAPLYEVAIRQGCDEGIFNTRDPLESAEILLAGIQFLTDIGFYPWKRDVLTRRALAIPRLIEAQLGAPEDSFDFLLAEA